MGCPCLGKDVVRLARKVYSVAPINQQSTQVLEVLTRAINDKIKSSFFHLRLKSLEPPLKIQTQTLLRHIKQLCFLTVVKRLFFDWTDNANHFSGIIAILDGLAALGLCDEAGIGVQLDPE